MLVPWHEIIEIGAIVASDETLEIIDTFGVKILPEHPERSLQDLINHYPERRSRGEWRDAKSLVGALHDFFTFLKKLNKPNVLIGQNISFDWSFMSIAFSCCNITEETWSKYFHYARLDTRSMAIQQFYEMNRGYRPEDFSLRNGLIQRRLKIAEEPVPHTALNGARQAYNLFKTLQKEKAGL